ncbi:MAG: WbqC family protein [bacterium]|nr:WbqC family protein [bacterium]
MKIAIMQPYFFPYIGYFQLVNAVDVFIIYDNIKYTKKGWINRNRILQNGKDTLISLAIKSDSDYLHVCDREISESFNKNSFLNRIKGAYRNAPYFAQVYPMLEGIIKYENSNLFTFLHNSIMQALNKLDITTKIEISSNIDIDHNLKSQDKVIALCKALGATTYINAIGGIDLYSKTAFSNNNIDLKFIKSNPLVYTQFKHEFCPWLSIIDVMMFNSIGNIHEYLNSNYELIEGNYE